jgi:hypothetical protein
MKDIHHTCRCTGQQFTFKEWCAWLDNHKKAGQDSGKFVALSYNGFDFNIHDVCLTPNRPVRLFNHHCIVEVKTAQSPTGRWDYGLDVNLHNSGHYVGAGFVDDVQKGYPTEAAAPDLLAVLEIIVGIFEPNKLTPYRSARETVDLAKQIIGYVYGADERNRPTNESPSNDAEFLEWLYVRLVGTHGENPNTDFMQNLNSIIEKLR